MRLYVEELKAAPLVQEFTRTEACLLDRVRLHLCKYLSPAGGFRLSVTDADDNVLATSTYTLAEMQAAGSAALQANYFHGFVSFVFGTKLTLRADTVYKLKLSGVGGYTYADGTFIGWVKDTQGDPIAGTQDLSDYLADAPYDYELYKLEKVR